MNITVLFININERVTRTATSLALMSLIAVPGSCQTVNLTLLGTTATQAVFRYRPPSPDPCRIVVTEFSTFTPVNDVNPSLFPGSEMDTRAIVEQSLRTIVVGKRVSERSGGRTYSRALRSGTRHTFTLICPGASTSLSFTTAPISGLVPEAPPFTLGADGNVGAPDFDWSDRSKPVIDPQSGAAVYRVGDPRDYSSDSAHHFAQGISPEHVGFPEPIMTLKAKTSRTVSDPEVEAFPRELTSSSETDSLFLPIDSTQALTWGGWNNTATQGHPITDLAIYLSGKSTGVSEPDRLVDICLSINSGVSCHTDVISAQIPNSHFTELGLYPRSYPSPLFSGWGKPITREFFTTNGFVTVSGSIVTLTKDDSGNTINSNSQSARSRFHLEWPTGAKIYIANSAPRCPLNYCMITSVLSQTRLTIAETLTLPENRYRFAGLGFLLRKRTNVGSISLTASYRMAKSYILHQGAASGCSTRTVTTNVDRQGNGINRSISGRLCVFPFMFESGGRLYFVGESEPEVRFLSLLRQPLSIPGHAFADLPNAVAEIAGPNVPTFDDSNPNVFYTGIPTQSGSTAMFRLTYRGDYRENTAAFWNSSIDSTPAIGDANVNWENLTRSEYRKDLRSQILAARVYDESKWGPLVLKLAGFTSRYAVFNTPPVGGRESPCWVFVFDAASGSYVRGWNTLSGGGEGSLGGGCHAVQVIAERVLIINNGLTDGDTSSRWGGPFDVPVSGIKRGNTFSSLTELPSTADGSYDDACPSDLPERWRAAGAVGRQCVTIRINREPCSTAASAHEKMYTPCPGDATKSWVGVPIDVGQDFYDSSRHCDDEHLMLVRRNDHPGGVIELVLLRDAAPGSCCNANNPRGRRCLGSPTQAVHASGWSLRMKPQGSCCSCGQVYDLETGRYVVEEQTLSRGHASYESLGSENHTFAGIGANNLFVSRFNVPPSSFGALETASFAMWPQFAGAPSDMNGSGQSYISVVGGAAGDFESRFAVDWRHPNGGIGIAPEAFGQTIGAPYSASLQPGTSSVYRVIGVSGYYNPKRNPLIVWVGRYLLREKSSPAIGNTLSDLDTWAFCYSHKAGECRENSSAGDVYVVAPGLDTSLNRCHASQVSYRSLCIFGGTSTFGQITQVRIDRQDPMGVWQRRLGYGLTRPGSQYVYSRARPYPNGKSVMFTAWNLQGVYSLPVLMHLPEWPSDGVNRTTFIPVSINGSGDASYVEFGYEENGSRDQFFCTPRAEACRVSGFSYNESEPFQYASTPGRQATGNWTITVPALPGRVLYHRIVTNGIPGPLQALPLP